MVDVILNGIRARENFNNCIIDSVVLESGKGLVTVKIITDKTFNGEDESAVYAVVRNYVPKAFDCKVGISKLNPDCDMIRKKIAECIEKNFKTLSVTVAEEDISVKKTQDGFEFEIAVMTALFTDGISDKIIKYLKSCFCGNFYGKCEKSSKNSEEIEVEEEHENIDFEIPIITFVIRDFTFLEGAEKQTSAVYISDLNFESEKVIVCGVIEDIQERNYTNSKNQEKVYYSFTINDSTASMRVTYFTRMKSIEKIRALKVGDGIVCTGKTEFYKGNLRFTANFIDYGNTPENFVPEKRQSKPVPKYYQSVMPKPFSDIAQADMFTDTSVPGCLKGKSFVVFDLETTGLNSSPSSGNMDRIIEIGAYKITDGVICESFTTFINPQKKLSEEIIGLTGITEEMVACAPAYEQVMPDFYKFCYGSILVGHNIAGFDFKFVDYYCARLGYMLERKLIDTIPLSQELLFLSNYKLNTVADKFGITFNHHRAIDDAYVTAKIFLELIKIKKSLPKLQ